MNSIQPGSMKKCPKCLSDVPVEATICAHCRSRLPRVTPAWWKAEDGVLYPPHTHPDFGKATAKAPGERPPMSTGVKVLIVIGALVVSAWMIGSLLSDTEPGGDDVLGREACEEFGDLRDIELYTDAELREQVQQVYRDGQYADSAAIRSASRELVSAVTVGDVERFGDAVADMAAACSSL